MLTTIALAALGSSGCGPGQHGRAQPELALQSTLPVTVSSAAPAFIGEQRTPVTSDEPPRARQGLRVRVEESAGRPCPNVRVDLWVESGARHSGVSDESGVLWLPVPCDEALRHVEARPGAHHLARLAQRLTPGDQKPYVDDVRELTLRLPPGGSLRLAAVGPGGEPLPWQVIVAQLQSTPAADNGYGTAMLATDDQGFLDFSNLPVGLWSLLGEAGRGYDQTDRREVEVAAGGVAECLLRFEALPDEDYAALRFPELAGKATDELMRSATFHVEIQGWQALHPIGGDGSFFTWDRDSLSLRVVDGAFLRVSQWLDVRRGDRLLAPALHWGPVEAGHWSRR